MGSISRPALSALVLATSAVVAAPDAHAGEPTENPVIVVTTTEDVVDADDGVISLREAVIQASTQPGDDLVRLAGDRYELALGCEVPESDQPAEQLPESGDLDHSGHGLTISGSATGGSTTIAVVCGSAVNHRILDHRSTSPVTIRNVTMTGGRDGDGGAVRADGDVEVVDGALDGNAADEDGGAIHAGGTVALARTTLASNSSRKAGGAVWAGAGLSASDAEFRLNTAGAAGGAVHSSGPVMIDGTELTENRADGDGGAVFAGDSAYVWVTESTVDANTGNIGGGIVSDGGSVEVSGSTVSGNTGFAGGGLVGLQVGVESSTITGNSSRISGGGVVGHDDVIIEDSSITGNEITTDFAEEGGAGVAGVRVYVFGSTIESNRIRSTANPGYGAGLAAVGNLFVVESTVARNTIDRGTGAGIHLGARENGHGTIFNSTISGNRVLDGSGGGVVTHSPQLALVHTTLVGNEAGVAANIEAAPDAFFGIHHSIVADPAGATSCASPTVLFETSVDGDGSCSDESADGSVRLVDARLGPLADNGGPTRTHLPAADSPAVDLDPSDEGNATDQRGEPRPQGPGFDAGSVERHEAGPILVTTTADVVDPHDGLTSLREAVIQAAERPGDDDVMLEAATYQLTLGCETPEDHQSPGDPLTGDLDHVPPGMSTDSLAIVGPDGDSRPVMRACASGSHRVLQDKAAGTARLEHVRLTGGTATVGGAVSGATVEAVDTQIDHNLATADAGAVSATSVDIRNSTIHDNAAGVDGGAISGVDVTIVDSHLERNRVTETDSDSRHGGGAVRAGDLLATGSVFVENEVASGDGGAVYVDGDLEVTDSAFTRNRADGGAGGAIVLHSDTGSRPQVDVHVAGTSFTGNSASLVAAIWAASGGWGHLTDSEVEGNTAVKGSGIYGEWMVSRSSFTGNSAETYGAIVGPVVISESLVADNTLSSGSPDAEYPTGGAGVTSDHGVWVLDSTIRGNHVLNGSGFAAGGGILAEGLALQRSTVEGNSVQSGMGGGIAVREVPAYPDDVVARILNSTVSGNRVGDGTGGGIHTEGNMEVNNATLVGNKASLSANLQVAGDRDVTVSGSIIDAPVGSTSCDSSLPADSITDSVDTDGSCSAPASSNVRRGVDSRLGPLAEHGGSTLTHLPDPSSPAVDLVPGASCPVDLDELDAPDQRGLARPVGPACDAGSVELRAEEDGRAPGYPDVPGGFWAGEAIDWVSRRGVVAGYPDGSFAPAGSITRAQAVQWLWNRAGRPDAGPHGFDDLSEGFWATDAVDWAAETGVVVGYRDGSFRPNEPVFRVQFVRMLWELSGSPEPSAASPYSDTPAWAADAIGWAAEKGIVTGYRDGTFRPDDPVTRAAATRMLYNTAAHH